MIDLHIQGPPTEAVDASGRFRFHTDMNCQAHKKVAGFLRPKIAFLKMFGGIEGLMGSFGDIALEGTISISVCNGKVEAEGKVSIYGEESREVFLAIWAEVEKIAKTASTFSSSVCEVEGVCTVTQAVRFENPIHH